MSLVYVIIKKKTVDGMQNIREVFQKNGFCSSRNVNPFNDSINNGVDFLTQYFLRSECEFSVMNTARSALSSKFLSEKKLTFGKQLIIQRLLKLRFKERPTFSR